MKQFIRSITLILLIGGWALASAAVQVIRTPANFVVIPKDRLGYQDTYVDTRTWTIADDRTHTNLVNRLITMGRGDVLAHTVNLSGPAAQAQLLEIAHSKP